MITSADIEKVVGSRAHDRDGEQVGTVRQVYLDEHGQPSWIALDTDLFASAEVFVPAAGTTVDGEGLRLPVTAAQVDAAPRIELEHQLTDADQELLRRHYRRGSHDD